MASYGKEDFVFEGLDDYNFSDFSDFSDDDRQEETEVDSSESEDVRQYCVCGGTLTKNMIGCDGENCPIEWWHYECAGMTADTIPNDDWYCSMCLPEEDLSDSSLLPASTCATSIQDVNSINLGASTSKSSDPTSKGKGKAGAKTVKTKAMTPEATKTTDDGKVKRKPRQKAPERPKASFTKEDALNSATALFLTSLQSMKDHPIFNCGSEASLGIISLVMQLLLNTEEAHFLEFCKSSVLALWLVLTGCEQKLLKPEIYESMWRGFHSYRFSSCAEWENLLKVLKISPMSDHSMKLSYQYLIQCVFGKLMKSRNIQDLPEKESATDSGIEKEEEKVLRYVAGYIPFALLKKYKNQKNATAKMYSKFLECWSVQSISSGRTFLTYTKEWIDAQNRGRLFRVSDDVYLFFRSIELVSNLFLTTSNLQKMSSLNINKVLMDNITTNYNVQTYWCGLVDNKLNGDASKNFMDIIIKFYIKLRCKSFLKVYLDIRKATKEVSKKGEKALRKDL